MAGNRVVIRFIGETADLRRAINEADGSLGTIKGRLSSVNSAFATMGKIGAGAFAFANVIPTAVGALATLAPAALAIPGVMLGAAAAVQTFKLATAGFADAVGGDAKALAELSPAARDAVGSVRGLEGGFKAMRAAVQDSFFAGLAPQITETGRSLLALGQLALPAVASGFNGMAKEALSAASGPLFNNALATIINNTAGALGNMRFAAANVLEGFVRLGEIGSKLLPGIGAAIDDVAARFNSWVYQGAEDGSINRMIDTAINGFQSLGDLIGAVGKTVATVWGGLQQGLGATATPLETLVTHVRAFQAALATPEAQAALAKIGEMIRAISDAFLAVLPHLVEFAAAFASIVAPAVTSVADAASEHGGLFAGIIAGSALASGAVSVVSGAVEGVTGVIETAKGVQEAWNFVTGLFGAQGAIVRGATMAWTAAQWLLNAALNANPIGIVVIAIAALVAGLIWAYNNVGWFKDAVDAAFSFIVDVVTGAVTGIVAAWNDVVAFFSGGPSAIGDFIAGIGDWFASLPGIIGDALSDAASTVGGWIDSVGAWFASLPGIIGDALATAVNAVGAWLANLPMQVAFYLGFLAGQVYTGAVAAWNFLVTTLPQVLAAVGAAIINFVTVTVPDFLTSLGTSIATGATAAWGWLVTTYNAANAALMAWLIALPGQIVGWLGSLAATVGQIASDAWNAFYAWSVSVITAALDWIATVPGQVGGFLSSLPGVVGDAATTAWTWFLNATTSTGQSALDWIAGVPGMIGGFFANAGSWLVDAGRAILEGLWNGLKSIAQGVLDWISNIGAQIANGFNAAVGIHSPSKVFHESGVNIGLGLIKGLQTITPTVVTATTDMGAAVAGAAPGSGATFGGGSGAPSGGGTTVHFTGNLGDELATVVMHLIRTGQIQIKAA